MIHNKITTTMIMVILTVSQKQKIMVDRTIVEINEVAKTLY